ncbi:Glucokinase 1 [Tritrichomonas foetus]|uniref:Glucokinase 1 n=1 Tax=Tritrichomonas foetus TaxID=1144522 RepID=A0A1J4K1U9_9EUKA|nr:glucokinase 1 [Tritrichomonas foetus]OHT05367.1 Glucokinase 1 [Tritrichomonas foetus]|eukprot:OHT05367.1 Glucokinase 1 [Tritrichomonas foetus]
MFAPSLLKPLASWAKEDRVKICVGVDIGGSGLRIRLSNVTKPTEFIDLPHIRAQSTAEAVESFTNLETALTELVPDFECRGAALAVAGPIKNGVVVMTNWPGDAPVRTLSVDSLPQHLFPKERTVLLNDLEAGAYGVIAADEQKTLDSHFEQLWKNEVPAGPIVSNTRTAVAALGSGLGVAMIVKTPLLKESLVLPCELGHLQVPSVCNKDPNCEEEYALIQHVSNHYYGGTQMPEYEDFSSGRGIALCYQFFLKRDKNERVPVEQINAGDVAEKARTGDKTARSAMLWCYKLFLRCCKEVATSLCCDSVLMALDNQVKNAWFVDAISDVLKEEFYNFIRPDWLKGIRVYTQIENLNFNILGTDYMAHRLAAK